MRQLGVDAYRFSIAWPRIVPDGDGPVNPAGLAFYDRLVDGLLEAGIRPFVTLYHWDLPQALQDRGGWPERDDRRALRRRTRASSPRALGDRVTDWITLNEPLCSAWIGHLEGTDGARLTDLTAAVRASHHLLLGHGLATQAIRAAVARTPRSASSSTSARASRQRPTARTTSPPRAGPTGTSTAGGWTRSHGRGYPADMVELYGVELPVRAGDLETHRRARSTCSGLNYYFRQVIVDDPSGPAPYARQVARARRPARPRWTGRCTPTGLEQLLVRLTEEYGAQRIFVTENGSAWPDEVGPDGQVDDKERTDYLEEHLAACARAVARGVPLAGYFAWSLLDNFEWAYGYDKRFGLVHVDYATQRADHQGQRIPRTPTSSAPRAAGPAARPEPDGGPRRTWSGGARPLGLFASPPVGPHTAAGAVGSVPVLAQTEAATWEANSSITLADDGASARSQLRSVPSQVRIPVMNASPAPMVLTTSTGTAGTETGSAPGTYAVAPCAPRVTTTSRPSSASRRQLRSGSVSGQSRTRSSSLAFTTWARAHRSRSRRRPRTASTVRSSRTLGSTTSRECRAASCAVAATALGRGFDDRRETAHVHGAEPARRLGRLRQPEGRRVLEVEVIGVAAAARVGDRERRREGPPSR